MKLTLAFPSRVGAGVGQRQHNKNEISTLNIQIVYNTLRKTENSGIEHIHCSHDKFLA